MPFTAVQVPAWWSALLAVRRISVRELAGLASRATAMDELEYGGPYRLVRHPLYLGWVLFFFGART